MRFDVITIFPQFFSGPLNCGILRRAREMKLIEIAVHDLRDYTHDRHRTVDDRPFGGGAGMVLKPEPLFEAVESLLGSPAGLVPENTAILLLSASGRLFRQQTVRRYATMQRALLLCGRYEGVDERVVEHLATEELSVGDFVLSGGELAAAVVIEAVTRLLPGALGNESSAVNESFSSSSGAAALSSSDLVVGGPAGLSSVLPLVAASPAGILDCPHYTRPQTFREWSVPDVLVNGDHAQIRRWRRDRAVEKTRRNRPDLLVTKT